MPTFPTPQPIQVSLDLAAGDAHLTATERDDTVVEIRPRDATRKADVRAADEARVELAGGRLLVKTLRQGLGWSRTGAVEVTIALPAGSRVDGKTGVGELRSEGVLGESTFKSGAGAIRLDRTGPLKVISGAGDISVDAANGTALVVTGTGAVALGAVDSDVIVKNGNGATTIGSAGGDVRVAASNGDIVVDRVAGGLVAKTANGSLRIGAVRHGDVELRTAFGSIEIGVAEGTAARLDVRTSYGSVRQELEAAGAPPAAAQTVAVKARTSHGDITIRRATAATAGAAAA
ncbi:MAG: DUF4097 family beta strand repeat-containing protein [Baekduia sp.]